jgi:hypothetical protein
VDKLTREEDDIPQSAHLATELADLLSLHQHQLFGVQLNIASSVLALRPFEQQPKDSDQVSQLPPELRSAHLLLH